MKAAIAFLVALHGAVALACGYCIEDRIAAVYDHAAIERAFARHHHVAFFAIDGELQANSAQRAMFEHALKKLPGVDTRSLLLSVEASSLAVGFDPERVSAAQIAESLQRGLALHNLTPQLLRVMTRPAQFESVNVLDGAQDEPEHHD